MSFKRKRKLLLVDYRLQRQTYYFFEITFRNDVNNNTIENVNRVNSDFMMTYSKINTLETRSNSPAINFVLGCLKKQHWSGRLKHGK